MRRIMLIGCSKTKLPWKGGSVYAEELYGGQLFTKRLDYAKRNGMEDSWFVLSAAFGLWPNWEKRNPRVHGSDLPYDLSISQLAPADFAAWHSSVAHSLVESLWEPVHRGDQAEPDSPKSVTVEIHAGRLYREPLATILRAIGFQVEVPCEGLGVGQQLKWYKERSGA
jgi:hypothetical protein